MSKSTHPDPRIVAANVALSKLAISAVQQNPDLQPASAANAARKAIDDLAQYALWLEIQNKELRRQTTRATTVLQASQAVSRIAIGHLQAILNEPRTMHESQRAESAARDWLKSIGSEPGTSDVAGAIPPCGS